VNKYSGLHYDFSPISILSGIGGFPSPASEYQQQELNLDEQLINHPSSTFLAVIDGNSIVKVGIHDKV
jgi:DNA polymerase V